MARRFRIVDKGGKIRRWEENLERPEAALKQIGALMVAESQRAFKDQKFGETHWQARTVPNTFGIIADLARGEQIKKRRFEPRPALMDKSRLRSSITFTLRGKDAVDVGTNIEYGAKHQFGLETESETITEEVQIKLERWFGTKAGGPWWRALRYLLRVEYLGKKLKMTLPARPFVGITKQTQADIEEAVGVDIFETGRRRRRAP